jgi:hypothetical protein
MYTAPAVGRPDPFMITPLNSGMDDLAIGVAGSTLGSAFWTATTTFLYPFTLADRHTYVRACLANGTTAAGNFDIGIYDMSGNRLFSTGTTAQATTSVMQKITTSWTFGPGNFYLAIAMDSASGTFWRVSPTSPTVRCMGAKIVASGVPLPSTLTLVGTNSSTVPLFGICEKTWI